MAGRRIVALSAAVALGAGVAPSGAAGHPPPTRQEVTPLPAQQAIEPPLVASPQAKCGPGSRPETGLQGRVSRADHESGRAAEGYTCNTELVGSYTKPNVVGSVGGFKVERYVDSAGHECAYYDTTLLFPTNIFDGEAGVNVLDMSEPSQPKLTARLVSPAMLSPHESLVVNTKRGLLAAVLGNPLFNVGVVDVYDISRDCRHPVLRSTSPVGILGHESGMAPDGRTFYSASPGTQTLVAVDISNPSATKPLWIGPYDSHGLSIGEGGDRAYVAGVGSGLIILDTSEIEARVPNPQVREVARLRWDSMSIPQNAIPVTIDGHPYVVEIDEFGTLEEVGAARMIDIGDEEHPRVISNMRLEVHQSENFGAIADDPGATSGLQGYAGHYCNVPSRVDPGIVACSMILSGLRVFDIRDPRHPKEIAYFNAPIKPRGILEASNWAMASPSFAPERGEIWYSDGFQGFFAVRTTNGVWPFPHCMGAESTASAGAKRTLGTREADVIVGSRAAERIRTRGGPDRVCAKPGRDRLSG
ncbi:MAG: LVIVD repeat-containing protein, partial [Solirubrobacterales bacterium]